MDNIIPKNIKELNLIVLMKFGSHLYDTNTENSDIDIKGIFLPTKDQILLNNIPKSVSYKTKKGDGKNTKDDIDIEVYSLHYFFKLASEGQTVALDMLHASLLWPFYTSNIWHEIWNNKEIFHSKSLAAFVGYARRQAAKYGIRGSRLNTAKKVIEFLEETNKTDKFYKVESRLKDVWEVLPEEEHIHFLETEKPKIYQVCGKKFQETVKVEYVLNILKKFYDQYGERARLAQQNKGIDWKALSHALRAAAQMKELLLQNTITFPRPEAEYLKEVKKGRIEYKKVIEELEKLMSQCEELAVNSKLPEKVNRRKIDRFLKRLLYKHLFTK